MPENKNNSTIPVYQKIFELTIEWGDQWKDSVNDRIKKLHPGVSNEEIEKITRECREIHKHSIELKKQPGKGKISQREFKDKLKSHFPNLSEENTKKLFFHAHPKVELKKGETNKNERLNASKRGLLGIFRKFF